MNHTKRHKLASEMTDFCVQRVQTSKTSSGKNRTVMFNVLVVFLAVLLSTGGEDPDRRTFWLVNG